MVKIKKGYGGETLVHHDPDKFEVMQWLETLEKSDTWEEFWFSSKLTADESKRIWNNYQILKDEINDELHSNEREN